MKNNDILLLEETINKYKQLQTYTTEEFIQKIITVLVENMYVLKSTIILYYSSLSIYTKGYKYFILKYKFYEFILEYYEIILDLIIYLLQNN